MHPPTPCPTIYPLAENPCPSHTHPDSMKMAQVPFRLERWVCPLPGMQTEVGSSAWGRAGGHHQPGVAPAGAF